MAVLFSLAPFLRPSAQSTKTLKSLILKDNRIGDLGAQLIIEALQPHQSVQRLDFSNNAVTAECDSAFAELLKCNRYLTYFSLSGNAALLTDSAVAMLVGAVKANKTLIEVGLQAGAIGDEGAAAIADMLTENQTLEVLRLAKNRIGDKGAAAIGDALKKNYVLARLSLEDNPIEEAGKEALAFSFRYNSSLTEYVGPGGPLPERLGLFGKKTTPEEVRAALCCYAFCTYYLTSASS